MLTLTESDINKLNTLLAELPMKYGIPFSNILQEAANRKPETQEAPEIETAAV